jgi:hypothetical protein
MAKKVIVGINDLKTLYPQLAEEWNYEKNKAIRLTNIMARSNKKVWWKCRKGHEWQAVVSSRSGGNGCPYCSGRMAIEGETDLATLDPKLSEEWNYERNRKLRPHQVTVSSERKIWWKCKKGHEWQATVNNRSNGNRCPYCVGKIAIEGETDMATLAPKLMEEWNYEKNVGLLPRKITVSSGRKVWWRCKNGHEWQATVAHRSRGRGCPFCARKISIEGETDLATLVPKLIEEWNYEKNGELLPQHVTVFSHKKVWWKCKEGHEWKAIVGNRSRGNGCPYCAGWMAIEGETDLATLVPKLIEEWNYEKNVGLRPQQITVSSGKKVWWKCKKGHEWRAIVGDRSRGVGCPYCEGKRAIEGETDLATLAPKLTEEWNYEKNSGLRPQQVTVSSGREVWWKCTERHEWQATVNNRSKGRGCPYCNGAKI